MGIKCLLQGHKWRFAYNHGVPLGTSTEEALSMIYSGKSYPVYLCTRCPKQSRILNNKRVILSRSEMEAP